MEYEAKQSVNLPIADFLELELHLMDTRPGVKPEALVTELVKRWLATETQKLATQGFVPTLHGFQWKTLFLPEGTFLRTSHGDNVEFAKVSGDRIISDDGVSLTPSLFANRHAKGRNAWRFIWLRFPGDEYWVRADNCRVRLNGLSRNQSKRKAGLSKMVHDDGASQSNPVCTS
jgi:hypothetical protein